MKWENWKKNEFKNLKHENSGKKWVDHSFSDQEDYHEDNRPDIDSWSNCVYVRGMRWSSNSSMIATTKSMMFKNSCCVVIVWSILLESFNFNCSLSIAYHWFLLTKINFTLLRVVKFFLVLLYEWNICYYYFSFTDKSNIIIR